LHPKVKVKKSYFTIMNKVLYTSSLVLAIALTVFTGCKKVNEGPFPSNPPANGVYPDLVYITPVFPNLSNASGIIIAAQVHDEKTVIISPFQNNYEYGMAKFTNTPGNFASLIDVGAITLNDSNLVKSNAFSYLSSTSTYSLNLSKSTSWSFAGNSNLPGFKHTLNGVYPTYSDSFQNWDAKWAPVYPRTLYPVPARPTFTHLNSTQIHNAADSTYYAQNLSLINTYISDSTQHHNDSVYNITVQYIIPIKHSTANADSVMIAMVDGLGFSYIRTVPATDSLAMFKPNDFLGYSQYDLPSFKFQVNVIKYQDTLINAKNYYFLKMGSYIKYYQATR
jgi:hypothetical protein